MHLDRRRSRCLTCGTWLVAHGSRTRFVTFVKRSHFPAPQPRPGLPASPYGRCRPRRVWTYPGDRAEALSPAPAARGVAQLEHRDHRGDRELTGSVLPLYSRFVPRARTTSPAVGPCEWDDWPCSASCAQHNSTSSLKCIILCQPSRRGPWSCGSRSKGEYSSLSEPAAFSNVPVRYSVPPEQLGGDICEVQHDRPGWSRAAAAAGVEFIGGT